MRGTLPMDFLTYFKINYTDDSNSPSNTMYYEEQTPAEKATERVATLIGDNFQCTDLFCQMDVLRGFKEDYVWQEMARWVRYEEAVEEGGQRWSKPHVASLMMEALQDLQDILITCPIILDCKANLMSDIVETVLDAWLKDRSFAVMLRNHFRSILLKPHKFQHYKKENKSIKRKPTNLKLKEAYINGGYEADLKVHGVSQYCPDSPSLALGSQNKSFMRKIPQGAEAVNLLIGEVEELERTVAAFIRLKTASNVGNITEVDIDTKFIFVILGPKDYLGHCAEIGRCMAALFTDEIFRCVAFRARDRGDILAGVHEFSLHLTVLPPGTWDPSTRIEPPDEIPSQDHRKTMTTSKSTISLSAMEKANNSGDNGGDDGHSDPTLVRTGRLFGGLVADIKRKLPFYKSDFTDALHIQCVASFFFLFLATLTPNVTFGGLLSQATDNYMGAMECILSASISGILFALFSGQPLNILGSTGPMLVLEGILYKFCKDQDWDFMPFRVWVGFWTGFMILLIVAFDLSALVRYITRFTEESFACLIALIFIYQAFKKTFGIQKEAKVHFHPDENSHNCFCIMENSTYISIQDKTYLNSSSLHQNETTSGSFYSECTLLGGTLVGGGCTDKYTPDVFFFSLILFFGTYTLATTLVHFRHSLFFPTWVRTNVSDFAVLISIIIMVSLDAATGIPTPKLTVPTEFKPTKPNRPWFINPISEKNPWWLIILSILPAALATILIFMDQQITAVIVNRRENKLQKGSGYHLDMLIVGILVVILSILGLPWYVAATVTALAHIMSLKKVSECTAPGEKPVFLGVREQRVTALLVGIFSGMAVFFTSVLRFIPMPVLYGVFLFMGVAPLSGMQLIQRILLIFMPAKYQPDYSYIRNVPIKRVHIFTGIQVLCLALLWVIKSVESISIGFPLMVLIICFVRKALDKVFKQRELKWLDDILPATEVKQDEDSDSEDKDEKPSPPQKQTQIKIQIDEPKVESRASTPVPVEPPRAITPPPTDTQETDVDTEPAEPFKNILIPRMSLTFMLKSDLDQLKANAPPELRVDRRKSLAMAVERKKSVQEGRPLVNQRRISGHSLLDGRRSHDGSLHDLYHNAPPSIVEEHNKLNRLLSMPATIADEDESAEESSTK